MIGRNGDSWLQGHRWCFNDTLGYGIDDDDDGVTVLLIWTVYGNKTLI